MDNRLAENIKRYRLMRGLDQSQLASLLAVSRVTYSKIETGRSKPTDDMFYRIAKVFGISPVLLLENSQPRSNPRFRHKKIRTQQENAFCVQAILDAERKFADYEFIEEVAKENCPPSAGFMGLRRTVQNVAEARQFGSEVRKFFFSQGFTSVRRLGEALEANGVKYLAFPFSTAAEFGFTLQLPSGHFAIAVNTNISIPGERQLFTLCHEVGHMLLHSFDEPTDEISAVEAKHIENEADAFASGLLLPDDEFEAAWRSSDGVPWFNRVLSVKKIFMVSYKTVLKRLEERSGTNPPPPYRVWFHQNYRRQFGRSLPAREEACPSDIRIESSRFIRLARKIFFDGEITMSRLAEVLGKSILETRDLVSSWTKEGAM